MTISEVKEICKDFSNSQKNAYDNLSAQKDIEELIKKPISVKTKNILKEEIKLINKLIEDVDKQQVVLIKELIDYIFDNKISISVNHHIEEIPFRNEGGGYIKTTRIDFVDEIGTLLWDLLHENQLFMLYYDSIEIPESHSFKAGMTKEEFIKVLNQYVCEGEAL